jgi:hypothetical protein
VLVAIAMIEICRSWDKVHGVVDHRVFWRHRVPIKVLINGRHDSFSLERQTPRSQRKHKFWAILSIFDWAMR